MRNRSSRLAVEIEHIHQIANRRRVGWDIRIGSRRDWIRKIVTAAAGQRSKSPVALDELQDRNMIIVSVDYLAVLCLLRNHEEWDARSVAKEIQRLKVAGIPETAALIECDEQGGIVPVLHLIDDVFEHAFEQVEF